MCVNTVVTSAGPHMHVLLLELDTISTRVAVTSMSHALWAGEHVGDGSPAGCSRARSKRRRLLADYDSAWRQAQW